MKKEISVNELKPGLYVSDLDRPWTDTPFLFQGFVIESQEQIDTLKKYCKTVFVDEDRQAVSSIAGSARNPTASDRVSSMARSNRQWAAAPGKVIHRERISVEHEYPRAQTLHTENETVLRNIVAEVHAGKALDAQRVKEATANMTDSVLRNPDALVLLTKLKDKGTAYGRALNVSIYMIAFGRFLQMPRETLDLLGMIGLMQDIGKVRIPTELLEKKGRLTHEEFELVKSHVAHSTSILKEAPGFPPELPELVSLHHERLDGSGYPRGLKGEEIGLLGSIAAIVDCFDALTMPRPYAETVSPSNALNMLYKWRNTLFHGALVEQFIQCIGIYPVGSLVELNTGEIGIVISQNLVRRLQPRVMVILDAGRNPMRPQKLLDLVREPKATADESYRILRTLEFDKVPIDPKEFFL